MPTLNSAKLYLGDTLIGSAALNDAKVYLGDTLIIEREQNDDQYKVQLTNQDGEILVLGVFCGK